MGNFSLSGDKFSMSLSSGLRLGIKRGARRTILNVRGGEIRIGVRVTARVKGAPATVSPGGPTREGNRRRAWLETVPAKGKGELAPRLLFHVQLFSAQ